MNDLKILPSESSYSAIDIPEGCMRHEYLGA